MIEPADRGFYINHEERFYHLTEQWLDEMWHHQVKHRRTTIDGRIVQGDNERAYNRLRHAYLTNTDPDHILELFVEFRDGLTKNRQDRDNLGLKAMTKHGDEDLRAVQNGAPVRPWNATKTKEEGLAGFIGRQRANRN